ncbi:transcription factor bHLH71 [Diospyros lotus]|uniref:transcription factor bHLH71 n=1 Tax=Diospyros lotus TaxID=55363 RepID=UPI00224C92EF|nr:transcription factor bHLH71 [Diospyros lotus]
MALEALSTNEPLHFIIHDYDALSANPYSCIDHSLEPPFMPRPCLKLQEIRDPPDTSTAMAPRRRPSGPEAVDRRQNLAVQGRKKRRRRPRICKNKEEAETQRMTHIAVERNRRKQMNEHLTVLRSLMPESYVQRGDQASIVGGAIDYVKELEQLLQSLEAQKFLVLQQGGRPPATAAAASSSSSAELATAPFAQFFSFPQYTWSQFPSKYASKSKAALADIEVTLIETHANLRILSRKCFRQLSKMVAAFQTLFLSVLHLSVTTLDPLVLYSISAKMEDGCQLTSADEIASAVHHMLRIIFEEDAILY